MQKQGRESISRSGFSKMVNYSLLALSLCGLLAISVLFFGVGTQGYFARFETPDEVVAFLYQNLEPNLSTPDDVLTFMSQHISTEDECHHYTINHRNYPDTPADVRNVTYCNAKIISALRLGGDWYYHISVYFYEDDTLAYIEVEKWCVCL